jgi:hypothetical protein
MPRYIRSAQRYYYNPTARYTSVGFRLVATVRAATSA